MHCKAAIAGLLALAFLSGSSLHALFRHKPAASSAAFPILTPEQAALLRRAAYRERFLTQVIEQHRPLIQTYIQHMRPDPQLGAAPISDEYLLGRIDFEGRFSQTLYKKPAVSAGVLALPTNILDKLTGVFRLKLTPNGFMDMMFV
ncbi:MAG: hypothetical protein WBE63_21310, partial [Acidobacteriaceae bacterium]